MDLLVSAHDWLKALHIIAIIAWMAALLYLPRLFVYHADAPRGSDRSEMLKTMERRLYMGILIPSMVASLILGVALLGAGGVDPKHDGWLHAKIFLVLILLGFSHIAGKWRRAFAEDRNRHKAKYFRIMNEVPTMLMVIIVILVVVKPF